MSQPQILFNPTDKAVEFMYDHQTYKFNPGEKKVLNGEVADHALRFAHAPLEVYDGLNSQTVSSGVAYDKMPWKAVVSIASKRKLFKPGMSKEAVFKALQEADEQGS